MNFSNLRVKEIHGIIRYTPQSIKWSAVNRKNHILGIQLSGEGWHDFGYKKFVLSRNCIFFFNQRDDYDVEMVEKGEAFSIHFTTYEEVDAESFCIPISNAEEIKGILERAERQKGMGAEGDLTVLSLLYKLLAEFFRIHEKTYSPKDKRLLDAKTYIDGHFREKDCLKAAVAQSGLTARRFGDLFKANFDSTPYRYVMSRKIGYAKDLLRTGELSVTEVAEASGFLDVYHFSKAFKGELGVSPSKWK